jgi:predicted exporter
MQKTKFPRWQWLAAGVGFALFVVAGLSRITFDVDILKLLPTHLRQVEGLSLFLKHFAQSDELIVTLEADTPETAEAAADALAERLAARPDLVKRAVSRPPWEKQPSELTELLAYMVVNQPPETIRELAARLSPEKAPATLQDTLERMNDSVSPQEVALSSHDPYNLAGALVGSLMAGGGPQSEFSSADGTFRVVYVYAAHPFSNYKKTIAWLKEIKKAAAASPLPGNPKLGFTGEPAFVASISSSTEQDMITSGCVTLLVIALIFWFCYRRARPLFELQLMLALIFAITLATAGLFLSHLTVIGVGCAAIMIGLSVDYGYFIYQRSRHHEGTVRELQRQCFQYITWTAGTTAAAFFALNLSSLPGLSQLGSLVGIGVIVGATVMLTVYAPLTMRRRQSEGEQPPSFVENLIASQRFMRGGAWVTLAAVVVLLAALAVKGMPGLDFSQRAFRPRNNEAQEALDRLSVRLIDEASLVSLVVRGDGVDGALQRLRAVDAKLTAAKTRGDVQSFRSALLIWPDGAAQRENLAILKPLVNEVPRLRQTMLDAGFTEEAFALTETVFTQWAKWNPQDAPFWPDNNASRWILRRVAAHQNNEWFALGIVKPTPGRDEALAEAIRADGTYLVSWELLGKELKRVIPNEFSNVLLALAVVVLGLLAFGFRSLRALVLFLIATTLVFACLTGLMSLLGMTWNFFDLAALLLLLGTGTDYSILILLAMKRNGGDPPAAQRELGLVVCLCASSAAAGFGTIGWANNVGLASLGITCCLGLLIAVAIAVFLLPPAWALLDRWRRPKSKQVAVEGSASP